MLTQNHLVPTSQHAGEKLLTTTCDLSGSSTQPFQFFLHSPSWEWQNHHEPSSFTFPIHPYPILSHHYNPSWSRSVSAWIALSDSTSSQFCGAWGVARRHPSPTSRGGAPVGWASLARAPVDIGARATWWGADSPRSTLVDRLPARYAQWLFTPSHRDYRIAWDHLPEVGIESQNNSQNNQAVPDPVQLSERLGILVSWILCIISTDGSNGKPTGKHVFKPPCWGPVHFSISILPYCLERPSRLQAWRQWSKRSATPLRECPQLREKVEITTAKKSKSHIYTHII